MQEMHESDHDDDLIMNTPSSDDDALFTVDEIITQMGFSNLAGNRNIHYNFSK